MEERDFLLQTEEEGIESAYQYLLEIMIKKHENSSVDWQPGKTGNRSIKIQQEMYNKVGQSNFVKAARKLEDAGCLRIKWCRVGSDVEIIQYRVEKMPEIYRLCGKTSKTQLILESRNFVSHFMETVQSSWLKEYGSDLLEQLEQGKQPQDLQENRELLFKCLTALDDLKAPIFVRIFSSRYLGNSKVFHNKLESRVIAIAKKYHSDVVDDAMEDYQVLEQLYLDSYAQELAVKGELRILLAGKEVNLAEFPYGVVLNTETLKHAQIGTRQEIRKIITVENKANYVSMPYEAGTLIIFSHGFFSPLERKFLQQLRSVLEGEQYRSSSVQYFHTGDLDYGGVRIFQHIRRMIFPKLKPLQMDVEQYEKYFSKAADIEESSWQKLKKVEEPCLQPLIERILAERKVIEQENFL